MKYFCAAMECASIAIVAAALEKDRQKLNVLKLIIYVAVYIVFYAVSVQFSSSVHISFISYILLFIYLRIAYKERTMLTLAVTVLSIIFAGIIEFLVLFIVGIALVSDTKQVGIYVFAVTGITFGISAGLLRVPLIGKILGILEKWEFAYAIVCILSLMIFTPMSSIKIFSRMDSKDYVYIAACIIAMWLLIFKVQQYKLDSKIRKQYLDGYKDVILQIRRRQHKIKNQINTAYNLHLIYDTYDELVEQQQEFLSRIRDYELPNDAITLEEPSVVALIYEKINEAVELDIRIETTFACSMVHSTVSDLMWVELIGTLFDNAIEALKDYDGEKRIWLDIKYADKNKISVKISNTYYRMKYTDIENFFKLGYSTKGENRGVGLYNVKEIVDKHHGNLRGNCMERDGYTVIVMEIIL